MQVTCKKLVEKKRKKKRWCSTTS